MPLRILLTALTCSISLLATPALAQIFRASFDEGTMPDLATGRAKPFVSKQVDVVQGKFGQAVQVPANSLVYPAEQNFPMGRGTLAFWVRVPELPGPVDVQRFIFIQCKERGYWNYLATMEWQEGIFRAMVFNFHHGHGWHDLEGLPAFQVDTWHHVALVWDQRRGTKFFLDGNLAGSTWGKQTWWGRPSPHAIHLCYPGAAYDELVIYDHPLTDSQVAALAMKNQWKVPAPAQTKQRSIIPPAHGLMNLPVIKASNSRPTGEFLLRQSRVRQVLDDRIPAWKVMDGRMDLFWPEWRSPTLGDVDFSGSELTIALAPEERATHLVIRGLCGGCRALGERDGFVSRQPILHVPSGTKHLAAEKLPAGLTGLRIPRQESMKLQEINLFEFKTRAAQPDPPQYVTPLTGLLTPDQLGPLGTQIKARTLPDERRVLGKRTGNSPPLASIEIAEQGRVQFVTQPVTAATPLDAVNLRWRFQAAWKDDVWWLRVQDPVNPRRDVMHVPIRVMNDTPGNDVSFSLTLDFWDIMLDAGTRLWIELVPSQAVTFKGGELSLRPGPAKKVLEEFAFTQSQLAFSYWQLGSEADGRGGSNPQNPSFNLLGGITSNYELKVTLEWIRRHVADHRLTNNLWKITHGKRDPVPVTPRLKPPDAPEWAIWNRELLERYRTMAHFWADWQGPDGQLGGGWNDDPTFPGVFLCLPLLGDTRTKEMFIRIFDGVEKTGYLKNGVCRGPIDTGHARDLVAWRGHLMLFDYGEPRHVERAIEMTRELHRWSKLDVKGHRRGLTNHISENGPERKPKWTFNDDGLIQSNRVDGDFSLRPLLMDSLFCVWYSRNPTVLRFVREVAAGEYARSPKPGRYSFVSYYQLFGDPKYVASPPNQYALSKEEKAKLVNNVRGACEILEGGWQFRGGEARGANDHFSVPGQKELSQMSLGYGLTSLRTAITMIPPIAVSWEGLEDQVATLVQEGTAEKLRVAIYNFDEKPRDIRMRVWKLESGRFELRTGIDTTGNEQIDKANSVRQVDLQRGSPIALKLPRRQVFLVELDQREPRLRPEHLPDLAVGDGDVFYDKATDRLKVVVHNIGSSAAKNVLVQFEDLDGNVLRRQTIKHLAAPLDLMPKSAVVWLPQPTLFPVDRVVVRIDPDQRIAEINRENNEITWRR